MSHLILVSGVRRTLIAAAAAAIGIGTGAYAQPTPPQPPASAQNLERPAGPGARPAPPRPTPRPDPAQPRDVATTTEMSGTLARWLINPNGDVDGMLLADGTQVAFPPHLSARVTDTIKPKDAIRLTGWRDGAVFRANSIRGTAAGSVVRDDGPPPPPAVARDPAPLTELSANGRVDTLLYGPRGEINGVVLRSGELVRFPPHVGAQWGALLQRGATLSARGYGTRNALGTAFEATAMGESEASMRQVFAAPRPPTGDAPALPPLPAVRPAS